MTTTKKVEEVAVNTVAREVVTKVTQWRVAKAQEEAARVAAERAAEAARLEAERLAEEARLEALRNTPEGYIKAVKEAVQKAGVNVDALVGSEFAQIDEFIKQHAYDYFYAGEPVTTATTPPAEEPVVEEPPAADPEPAPVEEPTAEPEPTPAA